MSSISECGVFVREENVVDEFATSYPEQNEDINGPSSSTISSSTFPSIEEEEKLKFINWKKIKINLDHCALIFGSIKNWGRIAVVEEEGAKVKLLFEMFIGLALNNSVDELLAEE